MAAVKHTITNVSHINLSHLQYLTTSSLGSQLAFTIIHSTMIALLAWWHIFKDKYLKPNQFPGSTQWNSIMICYHLWSSIRMQLTVDGWQISEASEYELDNDGLEDGARSCIGTSEFVHHAHMISISNWWGFSNITRLHCSSLMMLQALHSIIPAMDKLNNGLNPLLKSCITPANQAAMHLHVAKMNPYYSSLCYIHNTSMWLCDKPRQLWSCDTGA